MSCSHHAATTVEQAGADPIPPWLSHQCAKPPKFSHISFLASSMNDSLAIFHPLLLSAVG